MGRKDNSQLKYSVKNYCIDHLLEFIVSLPVLVGYGAYIVDKVKNGLLVLTSSETILLILCFVLTVVMLVRIAAPYFPTYQSYVYPIGKIKTDYIYSERSLIYVLQDNGALKFTRTATVCACIQGLESIKDRYIWTGKAEVNLPRALENIKSIRKTNAIGIWQYLTVELDHALNKGDEAKICYRWTIPNCTSSSPFVSTDTEYPTKRINFKLNLGEKFAKQKIFFEEYRSIESDRPISCEILELDYNGCLTKTIAHPKRFRHYRLRWTWDGGDIPVLDDRR